MFYGVNDYQWYKPAYELSLKNNGFENLSIAFWYHENADKAKIKIIKHEYHCGLLTVYGLIDSRKFIAQGSPNQDLIIAQNCNW